jgi:hypothetical protein
MPVITSPEAPVYENEIQEQRHVEKTELYASSPVENGRPHLGPDEVRAFLRLLF